MGRMLGTWRGDERTVAALTAASAGAAGVAFVAAIFPMVGLELGAISGAAPTIVAASSAVALTAGGAGAWLARARGRAVGRVLGALGEAERGERAVESLRVSEDGSESRGLNALLDEIDRLRGGVLLELTERRGSGVGETGEMLRGALNTLPTGVVLCDADGAIEHANGAACVVLGIEPEHAGGTSLIGFFGDERVDRAIAGVASPDQRRSVVCEVERAIGTERCVLRVVVAPVILEHRRVAAVTIEDTTQQHAAAEARSSFVAQVTHELRTPLTNIRLYVEEAIEAEDDPQTRARSLNVINSETRRLERIVSDMLSVSEMEAGSMRLNIDDLRLDALFKDLEAEYRAQSEEKQIEFTVEIPPKLPVIDADRDRISLALHNLVGNAFKYTPSGGRVTVRIEAAEGGDLLVDVEDTGIGISEADAGKIFEKFYRANDQRITTITGTGLGLAMAREIARMHGGDITVRSEIDRGSTFTMTLPARKRSAAAA